MFFPGLTGAGQSVYDDVFNVQHVGLNYSLVDLVWEGEPVPCGRSN